MSFVGKIKVGFVCIMRIVCKFILMMRICFGGLKLCVGFCVVNVRNVFCYF